MSQNNKLLSRRQALGAGLGAIAAAGSASLLAATGVTPAQVEGPFYPNRPQADRDMDLTLIEGHTERAKGEIITVQGQVLDDSGQPVANALVDVWQANAAGRYDHEGDTNPVPLDENFQGWGQIRADEQGRYSFRTIKPAAYGAMEDWTRPPHIHFKVSKRGYRELTTQMYFDGESLNDTDLLLQELPPDEQKKLLVAFAPPAAGDDPTGTFDIVLARVKPA